VLTPPRSVQAEHSPLTFLFSPVHPSQAFELKIISFTLFSRIYISPNKNFSSDISFSQNFWEGCSLFGQAALATHQLTAA
jgi:hypothetical protein